MGWTWRKRWGGGGGIGGWIMSGGRSGSEVGGIGGMDMEEEVRWGG